MMQGDTSDDLLTASTEDRDKKSHPTDSAFALVDPTDSAPSLLLSNSNKYGAEGASAVVKILPLP